MIFFKKYFILAACLVTISACTNKDVRYLSDYNEDFREDNLNVFLKSFSDHRQGIDMLLPQGSNVIYAYKPQSLMNGQMLPLTGYYLYHTLDFQDEKAENSVGIDVSIRKVETAIRYGAFPNGKMGRYKALVQARVILRDIKRNEVIGAFPVFASKQKIRTTNTGKTPTAATDQYELLELLDDVSFEFADKILEESEDLIKDYFKKVAKNEKLFEKKLKESLNEEPEEEIAPAKKAETVKLEQIQEADLNIPPEVLSEIEAEERRLMERRAQQNVLFKNKIKEQQQIDTIDANQ